MDGDSERDVIPTARRNVRIASWAILALTLSAIWVLSRLAISQRQVTQKLLADFGVELSTFTIFVLSIPNAAIVGTAVIASAILVVKEWLMQDKKTALILNLAAFAVSLLLYAVHREALITPLQKALIQLTSMR